jgi:hypothetical protein
MKKDERCIAVWVALKVSPDIVKWHKWSCYSSELSPTGHAEPYPILYAGTLKSVTRNQAITEAGKGMNRENCRAPCGP